MLFVVVHDFQLNQSKSVWLKQARKEKLRGVKITNVKYSGNFYVQ
jgi:hypothetical protein